VALFEPLFAELNQSAARYVVVGGLATVLHGFARLTADVDLIVDLEPAEARKVIDALVRMGFHARAPVDPIAFCDAAQRRRWIADKGMRVFSMWDPTQPLREVDLFVESPIEFELLWNRSEQIVLKTTTVRVAAIDDLILLKQMAGRPQDRIDVEALEQIRRQRRLP